MTYILPPTEIFFLMKEKKDNYVGGIVLQNIYKVGLHGLKSIITGGILLFLLVVMHKSILKACLNGFSWSSETAGESRSNHTQNSAL